MPRLPAGTPASRSHSTRAAGDPRDRLLARETHQPQDPGCLTANSKARIIFLAHMPVGSTDLEDTSRLLPAHDRHTATKTVAGSQRTWQEALTCTEQQTQRWESVRGSRFPHGGDSPQHGAKEQEACKQPQISPTHNPQCSRFCKAVKELTAEMLICCCSQKPKKTSKNEEPKNATSLSPSATIKALSGFLSRIRELRVNRPENDV